MLDRCCGGAASERGCRRWQRLVDVCNRNRPQLCTLLLQVCCRRAELANSFCGHLAPAFCFSDLTATALIPSASPHGLLPRTNDHGPDA